MKDLKSQNEFLKVSEKKLKEEISSLNDKIRSLKLESQRREQIIKEYKDRLDMFQEEVSTSKDKT